MDSSPVTVSPNLRDWSLCASLTDSGQNYYHFLVQKPGFIVFYNHNVDANGQDTHMTVALGESGYRLTCVFINPTHICKSIICVLRSLT